MKFEIDAMTGRDGSTSTVYVRLNDRQAVGSIQPDDDYLVFVYVDENREPVGVNFVGEIGRRVQQEDQTISTDSDSPCCSDPYPSDEELRRIREWAYDDPRGWFAFIKERWKHADVGYWREGHGCEEYDGAYDSYHLSTVGWSGNEELVGAMKENFILWGQHWEQSRKGGHYEFRVRKQEDQTISSDPEPPRENAGG